MNCPTKLEIPILKFFFLFHRLFLLGDWTLCFSVCRSAGSGVQPGCFGQLLQSAPSARCPPPPQGRPTAGGSPQHRRQQGDLHQSRHTRSAQRAGGARGSRQCPPTEAVPQSQASGLQHRVPGAHLPSTDIKTTLTYLSCLALKDLIYLQQRAYGQSMM